MVTKLIILGETEMANWEPDCSSGNLGMALSVFLFDFSIIDSSDTVVT